MNVLVTGGAGYIGYSLVHQLAEHNDDVDRIVVYDNLSRKEYGLFTAQKFPNGNVEFVRGEILDGRKLAKALKGIDTVIHLAAKVTTPYADRDAHTYDQVNNWGTSVLVSAVEQSDVSHFIYLSSTSIYGSTTEIVDEDTDSNPNSFYGTSKLHAEEHVERLMDQMKTHIIRSGNVYGYNPSVRIDAVINRFMFEAQFQGRLRINGDGDQYRSFIGLNKLVHVVNELLHSDKVPGSMFNLVEHNLTINDIAEHIRKLYPEVETLHVNRNMKMKQIRVQTPCTITKLISLPKTSIDEELQDFKNHFAF